MIEVFFTRHGAPMPASRNSRQVLETSTPRGAQLMVRTDQPLVAPGGGGTCQLSIKTNFTFLNHHGASFMSLSTHLCPPRLRNQTTRPATEELPDQMSCKERHSVVTGYTRQKDHCGTTRPRPGRRRHGLHLSHLLCIWLQIPPLPPYHRGGGTRSPTSGIQADHLPRNDGDEHLLYLLLL